MSYNGIGLATARGSGTNGYVTRNLSSLKPYKKYPRPNESMEEKPKEIKQPNLEILNHERKRKIEIACLELEDDLSEQGLPQEEIETRIKALRAELQAAQKEETVDPKKLHSHQVHQLAAAKLEANDRFAKALKLKEPSKNRNRHESESPERDYPRRSRDERDQERSKRRYRSRSRSRQRSLSPYYHERREEKRSELSPHRRQRSPVDRHSRRSPSSSSLSYSD